jgi:hypothetical protein
LLLVLQSYHHDLETVLSEIASGRNLPQPQGSKQAAAASEVMKDDDTSCPPSPGGSNTASRRGSRSPTDDLAAFSSEQPTAAAALALLKFHNPGLGLMVGLQAAAAAASSEDSKAPAGIPGSVRNSPMSAGSSRVSIDFAWGEQPAEATAAPAASASRDSHVRTDEAEEHVEVPVSSVQQAALAARLRAMGVGNAFAAAGFAPHCSTSSHTEIEAQQQHDGQQDDESMQPQDDLTLNDAIAATALLASVFKLGEQQQRLVIGGLLGTGLFAAPDTAGSIEQTTSSSAPQRGQPAALAAGGCTLAAQQHCSSIKVDDAVQGQEAPYKAAAAASFPAAALAADGSLQDSVPAQQQQVSCATRSTTANSIPAKVEEAIQQQAQTHHSLETAAGHQPMPATAMAFLATLLARQGAPA